MSSRTIWTDADDDEIELTQFDSEGELHEDRLWLVVPEHPSTEACGALFEFSKDDARTFAARLLQFAEEAE